MLLIADTNILFSYFWKNSATRGLLQSRKLDIRSPQYALEEINSKKKEIIGKASLSAKGFRGIRADLAIYVDFLPLEGYLGFLKEAVAISPDPNDADFFALALKMKAPLWSNDSALKTQGKVSVVSTKELLGSREFIAAMMDG